VEPSEDMFERLRIANLHHPFDETSPGYYVMQTKRKRRHSAVLFFLLVSLPLTLFLCNADFYFYVIYAILAAYPFHLMLSNIPPRTYVIDTLNTAYEFYIGEGLVYKGHMHNFYVRLEGHDDFYKVLFNGYLVEEFPVTSMSKDKEKLGLLARRLAEVLKLNFMDCTTVSRSHIIRHKCPYMHGDHLKDLGFVP